jgi:inhibitor of KinA sporulation pathway (predicted exonuclease)
MDTDRRYISLDLELDQGDIIEVGVVCGAASAPSSTWEKKSWLVVPRGKNPISEPITRLTGITQSMIDSEGVDHYTLRSELVDFIHGQGAFVNPVQWGLGDAQELLDELESMTGSKPPLFGRRVIDVKHLYLYVEAANGRSLSGGLRSSMGRHGLQFSGTPHRAVPDAFNTLRFFFHLLRRQYTFEQIKTDLSAFKR